MNKNLEDLKNNLSFSSEVKGFYALNDKQVSRTKNYLVSPLEYLLPSLGYKQYKFPTVGLRSNLQKQKSNFKEDVKSYFLEGDKYFLKGTSEPVAYPILANKKDLKLPFKWFRLRFNY